jgi:uncharacterized protein (DUF58 family)
MHLRGRALSLIAIAAALGIAGLWSDTALLAGLWLVPLALLAAGLAGESARLARLDIAVELRQPDAVLLGQHCDFVLSLTASHDTVLEWLPIVPPQFAAEAVVRSLSLQAGSPHAELLRVLPVQLGAYAWGSSPLRVRGRWGLAEWDRALPVADGGRVMPDLRQRSRRRVQGRHRQARARRAAGEGSELQQLRDYRVGDPLARIAWKRSARHGRLLTREGADERQLDVLLVVDAGLRSATAAGRLDRLGVHVGAALALSAAAAWRGDRVGLLLHAGKTLAAFAPTPEPLASLRIARAFADLRPVMMESPLLDVARRARALLRRETLVVWFADVDETLAADDVAGVVRQLMPKHRLVFVGVDLLQAEALRLQSLTAGSEQDAWVALVAAERVRSAAQAQRRLRALGVPVVAASPAAIEDAVLREYARQR